MENRDFYEPGGQRQFGESDRKPEPDIFETEEETISNALQKLVELYGLRAVEDELARVARKTNFPRAA